MEFKFRQLTQREKRHLFHLLAQQSAARKRNIVPFELYEKYIDLLGPGCKMINEEGKTIELGNADSEAWDDDPTMVYDFVMESSNFYFKKKQNATGSETIRDNTISKKTGDSTL